MSFIKITLLSKSDREGPTQTVEPSFSGRRGAKSAASSPWKLGKYSALLRWSAESACPSLLLKGLCSYQGALASRVLRATASSEAESCADGIIPLGPGDRPSPPKRTIGTDKKIGAGSSGMQTGQHPDTCQPDERLPSILNNLCSGWCTVFGCDSVNETVIVLWTIDRRDSVLKNVKKTGSRKSFCAFCHWVKGNIRQAPVTAVRT